MHESAPFQDFHGRMIVEKKHANFHRNQRLIVGALACKASRTDVTLSEHHSSSISPSSQLFRDAWNFHIDSIDCGEECIIFDDSADLETSRADVSKHGEPISVVLRPQDKPGTLRASLFAQLLEEHDMGTLLRPPGLKMSSPKLQ